MDKVTDSHLKRNAFLYIRQSTIRQVFENTESTERQYALSQRAVALGWNNSQINVIDSDLGQSGASAENREGFKKLVMEVSLGNAGIVMGLEVSRLARNSSDWHRLLEICALTDTLILDEDGVYNPSHFNDRLLLGLKGTMSEAELHVIKARLLGGLLNKARRGELRIPLPVGFLYDSDSNIHLSPDKQVRESIKYFFETFSRTGSARATVRTFRKEGILFPKEIKSGSEKGDIIWIKLTQSRATRILHNPRYAGAYCYGKTRSRSYYVNGKKVSKKKSQNEWITLIKNAHQGYISWEEFEKNEKILNENTNGFEYNNSLPREGSAILQGLVICGKCGNRMRSSYYSYKDKLYPAYLCEAKCQNICGREIDQAISKLLLETITPMNLEIALKVRQEVQNQLNHAESLRKNQVERAQYEADLAKRRYMQVDPENRLVADELECQWNEKLKTLKVAHEEYDFWKKTNQKIFDDKIKERIMTLASDFPEVWNSPETPYREKKRMVRLIIEDVTMLKNEQIILQIRFKGGTNKTLVLPRLLRAWEKIQTPPDVIKKIDTLLNEHRIGEVAKILNEQGYKSGKGIEFTSDMLRSIQKDYKIKSYYDRLREKGLYTLQEIAEKLNVGKCTINVWRKNGLLKAIPYNENVEYLYEDPGENFPVKSKFKGIYSKPFKKLICESEKEV